jgi:hypothetical protein
MNRRGFFSTTIGAFLLGPIRWSRPSEVVREFTNIRLIDVSPIDAESFREMIQDDPRWRTIRKDIMESPSFTVEEDDD